MTDRYGCIFVGLELRRCGGLLAGRLVSPGEPDRPFSGWLDFIAAVEAAHSAVPAATPVDSNRIREDT